MKSLSTIFRPFSTSPSSTQQNSSKNFTEPPMAPLSSNSTSALTVIELFQSQGCNSCPPANDACIRLASHNDPSQLLLTYEVTYWDHLGSRDTFGDARWDARQREYAAALKQRSCYTPQVIVDGGAQPMGNSWANLPAVLARGRSTDHPQVLKLDVVGDGKRGLKLSGETRGRASVTAVFYEADPETVKILRGENRGEMLPHRNIVRDMKLIGTWEGGEHLFDLPAARNGLEMAVLVQAGKGGEILGAVRV